MYVFFLSYSYYTIIMIIEMLCILFLIRETWLPKIVMSVEEAVANGRP